MPNYEPEIYSDLSYKPQLNQLGDATKLVNMNSIKQAIKTIILTPPGSRLFEPNFGCGINNYLFEFNDEETKTKLERAIRNSIATYEPRVLLNSVIITSDVENSQLNVEIEYLIKELQEYDSTKISLAKL